MKATTILCLLVGVSACTFKPTASVSKKTLNIHLGSDVKGFDPIACVDNYSHTALLQIYEGLLQYKYQKPPYELEPLLAKAMPKVSRDGLTYTFQLRDDVFFHEDRAFVQRTRKCTASDVVFSFQRLADPHLQSPNWWLLEGRVVGLDEFREKLRTQKPTATYQAYPVAGLKAWDDHTFVMRLRKPHRQLLYALAMPAMTVVAPEVVEKYGDELLNHPVGTGPFLLKEWKRGQRLVFERNPTFHKEVYPVPGSPSDRTQGLLTDASLSIPFADELVLWIYTESQPLWLNFLKGNLDLSPIPKEAYETVFDEKGEVKKEIVRKRIVTDQNDKEDVVLFVFNMDDPIVGKNMYLRQAISCAINREEKIKLFYNNRATLAHGPIPRHLFGYDSSLKDPHGYNVKQAKALMKKAQELHRKRGGKGDIPAITYDVENSTWNRQLSEAIARDLEQIGLKVKLWPGTWPQLEERRRKRQSQFSFYAWVADYPDPENFLQLFYGQNVSPGPNVSNFQNADYDRLFEMMRDAPDSAKRRTLIAAMIRIIHEQTPVVFFVHRMAYFAAQAWLANFKRNPFSAGFYKYLRVNPDEKRKTLPFLQ